MNRVVVILFFIGLVSVAWNLIAAALYLLFGIELPIIDQGSAGLGL